MIYSTQMLTFFGTMCLIVLTEIASSTDDNLSEKSQCIEPISYEMNIFPHIHNNSLNVDSRVTINVTCKQLTIRLNFGRYCDNPKITILTDIRYDFTNTFWKTIVWSLSEDQFKSVHITLEHIDEIKRLYIIPGIYQILAKYTCTLNKVATISSCVRQSISEETKYLILPRFPAEWIFPYWKNPETEATFSLRIYHNNKDMTFSHRSGDRILEGNTSYTYYPFTPVMSTHLVAIVVTPSESFSNIQYISSMLYGASLLRNIKKHVKKNWKGVPWSHVYYVLLPINSSHYESIITKNLVLFNDAAIVYDNKKDALTRKKEVTCLVARSVIQEMFSNWLGTFKQSNSWFMEGFLTFYGVYIIDKINAPVLKSMVVQTRREILDCTEAFITYDLPVKENSSSISPSSMFTKLWRKKAFTIFYTITDNHDLYKSMFAEAIRLYYNTTSSDNYNAQSNFNTLWSKLMVEKHKNMSLIQTLTTVITSWPYIAFLLVQVNRHNNTRTLEIMIRDCFLSNIKESCLSTWWIPVTYVKISKLNTKYKSFLQPNGKNIVIPNIEEDDSVIFIDTPGYRVNYDRKSWNNIARFLKNETSKMSNLSDITLAQILDDAFYFLVQNTDYNENPASYNTDNLELFFDLASSIFQVNNSYIAWYPIFTVFEYLSKIFPYPESAHIKNKILDILNKFLDDSSHTPSSENNVNNQLYYEVLKWTCILDGLKCKDIVNIEFTWHVRNSAKNKLLLSWQKWIYCQNFIVNNFTYESPLWDTLVNMYETQSKVEEMFEFLHCSRHNWNIFVSVYSLSRYFLPSYRSNVNLKKSDSITFLFNIFAKHSKNVESLTSILRGIQTIESDINIVAIITCVINNIYSDKGLSMITDEKFYQKLTDLHSTPSFLIGAIEEKIVNRRNFLIKIRNKLRYRPYKATYKYLFL